MSQQEPAAREQREQREQQEKPNKHGPSTRSRRNKTAGKPGNGIVLNPDSPCQLVPSNLAEPRIERPGYETHDDFIKLNGHTFKPGLYWHGNNDKDGEPVDQWIASPIYAVAITRDDEGGNFGLLLRFMNADGQWREWAAPMLLLKGSGEELRGNLLDQGVRINPRRKNMLLDWIRGCSKLCVTRASFIG